jgi:hypothetical protein
MYDVCAVVQRNWNAFLEESAESRANFEFIKAFAAAEGISTPADSDFSARPSADKREIASFLFDQETFACILHLAKLAPILEQAGSLKSKRDRGRPFNPSKNVLKVFVQTFLDTVAKSEGKVTFNKNYETSGTRAMCILAPFLPPSSSKAFSRDAMAEHYKAWKVRTMK